MFDGFAQRADGQARKRFAVSTSASLIVYFIIGAGIVALASRERESKKDDVIEVSFRKPPAPEPAAKPEPPPKPQPKPQPKPRRRAAAKPVRVATTSAPIPTAIPDGELAEGNADDFEIGGSLDDILGSTVLEDSVAATPPPPPPPPPTRAKRGPIIVPEEATPPVPAASNRSPVFPEDARVKGVEGEVILKVVVDEHGRVKEIVVLRGDEPFVAAAVAAVETWRYAPALVDGEPTSVYRIIKVPFKLKR